MDIFVDLATQAAIKRSSKPCPEPHHAHQHDEKAHRWHHWKERAFCLSCCTTLHFILEYYSHVK